MTPDVGDAQLLAAIRPADVASYLRATGWNAVGRSDAPMSVWRRKAEDGRTVEVGAPRHQGWADYARELDPLLRALARFEDRSEISIIRDISSVDDDIVRLRVVVAGDTAPDGSIPWADGIRLPECIDQVVTAAARAAHEPKKAYHAKKPDRVTEYLASLRLGQTEQGSYIVTVLSRVRAALPSAQGVLFPDIPSTLPAVSEEPFERKVTRTLATALEATRAAAVRSSGPGDDTAFEEATSLGVSADLCEGLSVLLDAPGLANATFRIGWSHGRPPPPALGGPQEIAFARDTLTVIRDAGRRLREKTPVEGFELLGMVVGLSRPEHEMSGMAVIYGIVDKRPHRVAVELSGADWALAHKSMAGPDSPSRPFVRCEGTLLRDRRPFRLEGARNFREVTEEQSSE